MEEGSGILFSLISRALDVVHAGTVAAEVQDEGGHAGGEGKRQSYLSLGIYLVTDDEFYGRHSITASPFFLQ